MLEILMEIRIELFRWLRKEIADDLGGIDNADLYVQTCREIGVFIDGFSLMEGASDSIIRGDIIPLIRVMQIFDDGTIERTVSAIVRGHRLPVSFQFSLQMFIRFSYDLHGIRFRQIEAFPQIDDGSQDQRVFYRATEFLFLLSTADGVSQRPVRIVLPEINTGSKPVPGIVAGSQMIFSR